MIPTTPFRRAMGELRHEAGGLSWYAKFLLVRALFVFGRKPSEDTKQHLALKIGLPVGTLVKAQKELVRKGMASFSPSSSVSRQTLGPTTQGQFRSGFVLNPAVVSLAADRACGVRTENRPDRAFEMLRYLLLWRVPVRQESARYTSLLATRSMAPQILFTDKHKLSARCRLLIGVLCAYADEFGVVWDCGVSRLAELTGMDISQVDYQLARLKKMRLIHHHIPGCDGSLFFNRSSGAFILNFDDQLVPSLNPKTPVPEIQRVNLSRFRALEPLVPPQQPSSLLHDLPGKIPSAWLGLVHAVAARFAHPDPSPGPDWFADTTTTAIGRVSRALLDGAQSGELAYARYRICLYASELIRDKCITISPESSMIDRIRQDILKPGREHEDGFEFSVGAAMLYHFAHSLRDEVMSALPQLGEHLVVVPGPLKSDQIWIMARRAPKLAASASGRQRRI